MGEFARRVAMHKRAKIISAYTAAKGRAQTFYRLREPRGAGHDTWTAYREWQFRWLEILLDNRDEALENERLIKKEEIKCRKLKRLQRQKMKKLARQQRYSQSA
jgi:hypothetical protein